MKLQHSPNAEHFLRLSDLASGSVFHMVGLPLKAAVDGHLIWMRTLTPEANGKCQRVNLVTGEVDEVNSFIQVVVRPATVRFDSQRQV